MIRYYKTEKKATTISPCERYLSSENGVTTPLPTREGLGESPLGRWRGFVLFLSFMLFWLVVLGAKAQSAGNRYAEHSVLKEGRWVKIRVEKAGIYQITHSSLRSMGFANPEKVRLYGLNVEVLPENGLENLDDDLVELPLLRTEGKVLFYGRGTTRWTLSSVNSRTSQFTHFNNPYATSTCYFLTENTDGEPLDLEAFAYETESNAPTQITFPEHALLEQDEFSYMNSGRTFFYAYDFQSGNIQTYTLPLPGIADQSHVNLNVQFVAKEASSYTVTFNDTVLATQAISSPSDSYESATLSNSRYDISPSRRSEKNTIKLVHTRGSGISGHLDYIQADYLRRLSLQDNELLFRPSRSGDQVFVLTEGKSETIFWHINGTTNLEEVAGTFDSSTNTWRVPFSTNTDIPNAWKDEEIVAFNPSASFPSPTVVGTIENQDLHALSSLDYVVIVPTSGKLLAQAQRLANAHVEQDSLRTLVITVDKIYNEFSAGSPDATAIRRFMKMLYDKAESDDDKPKNLLLFGDCYWDNRLVTSALRKISANDILPTYQSDNSLSHTKSYVLEDYFGLVDDNAPSNVLRAKPRVGVGRIPVTTVKEAKDVVDKLLTYIYNKEVGSWKNTIGVLCDDGNANVHMEDGDAVIEQTTRLTPDFRIQRIYWDTYERVKSTTGNSYPATQKDIDKLMQDGALIMNYTGHGASYCLSHEQVMRTENFAAWSSPRLPLWITAACDVTPFDMNTENQGVTALLNPKGAAMGFVGTARTVYSSPNRAFNLRYMRYLLDMKEDGSTNTLGEALALAKTDYLETYSTSIPANLAHFVLLGDPAIKLARPTYTIAVDKINEMYAPGTPQTVSAGSLVKVEGHIVGLDGKLADDFNGLVSPVVMDNVEQVVCKNNSYGEDTHSGGNGDTPAHQFSDRLRTLYTCSDSVRNGRFTLTFPIPLDNNYSGEAGLISLYAHNADHKIEAHGRFENFLINGTATDMANDTVGPAIECYLNTDRFTNGSIVNPTPLLVASLHDESGINMTGSGVGHDITAMIDNSEPMTYSLNSYFTPTVGSYQNGTVTFSIPELEDGHHTLTLRAFDILNNTSAVTIDFFVNQSTAPDIFDLFVNSPVRDQAVFTIVNDRPQSNINLKLDVYDVTGRSVWSTQENNFSTSSTYTFTWNLSETDSHLPAGIYIVKAQLSSAGSHTATTAKKFIVSGRR